MGVGRPTDTGTGTGTGTDTDTGTGTRTGTGLSSLLCGRRGCGVSSCSSGLGVNLLRLDLRCSGITDVMFDGMTTMATATMATATIATATVNAAAAAMPMPMPIPMVPQLR